MYEINPVKPEGMCTILYVKQMRSLTFYECVLLGLRSGTANLLPPEFYI